MWLLFTIGLSWSCNTVNVRKEKTGLFRSNLSEPFHQHHNHHSSSLIGILLSFWFNFFFLNLSYFWSGYRCLAVAWFYLINSKKMKTVILNDWFFFISNRVCLKKNHRHLGCQKGVMYCSKILSKCSLMNVTRKIKKKISWKII